MVYEALEPEEERYKKILEEESKFFEKREAESEMGGGNQEQSEGYLEFNKKRALIEKKKKEFEA